MIKELASLIASRADLVIGETLFIERIPEITPDDCVALIETGGVAEYETPEVRRYQVQALARGATAMTARTLCQTIWDALHGELNGGFDLPLLTAGEQWHLACADGMLPQSVGLDSRQRFIFSSNFTVTLILESAATAPAPIPGVPGEWVWRYDQTFDNDDLTDGIIVITHNLNTRGVHVQVFDNNGALVSPDQITVTSANAITVALASFAPLSGTWRVVVLGG